MTGWRAEGTSNTFQLRFPFETGTHLHCSPCLFVSFLQGPALFGCHFPPVTYTFAHQENRTRSFLCRGWCYPELHPAHRSALIQPQPCDSGVKGSSSTVPLLLSLSLPTPPSGPCPAPPGSLTPRTPRGRNEEAPQPEPGPPAPPPPEAAQLGAAPPPPPHHLPRAAAAASACGFRLHAPRSRGAPAWRARPPGEGRTAAGGGRGARDPDTCRRGGVPGTQDRRLRSATVRCARPAGPFPLTACVEQDYNSRRTPRRAERQLSRDSPKLTPGLHFPPAFSAPEVVACDFRVGVWGQRQRQRRRRGARRWGGSEGRQQAGSAAVGMDVTGPETDWRSTNFRQKLVSQMWVRAAARVLGRPRFGRCQSSSSASRCPCSSGHGSSVSALRGSFAGVASLPGSVRGPCYPCEGPSPPAFAQSLCGGAGPCLASLLRSLFLFALLFPGNSGCLACWGTSVLGFPLCDA